MSGFLPFVVIGIATGALYGLAGTGLVLTYKTSGIFNFGYGAIAAAAAYCFYFLHEQHGMGWVGALLLSVVVLGLVVGLAFEKVAERLAPRPMSLKIVATVGIVLVVQGLATIAWGPETISLPQFLPGANTSLHIAGATVTWDQVVVAAVAVTAVVAFYCLFRFSRTGVAMRAVVDDPDLLAMQATDPAAVRRSAWVIGSMFAALSGVLIAPLTGLDSILLTYLVVQAFGAAAIGWFSNIPMTFLGGLLIGVGAAISTKYVVDVPWLAGLPSSLPFIVLFVALLVIPRQRLVSGAARAARPVAAPYRAPARVRWAAGAVAVAGLALVPQLVGGRLPYFTESLVTAVLLLSLGLLVRTSGQVSLCHATFAAVGAVAFSQLHVDQGVPWLVALVAAGAITMVIGAVVAIPAIRLSGLFLALATLGFGILVERLLYAQSFMFTTFSSGREMPLPGFVHDQKQFFYVVVGVLVLTSGLVVAVQRSRLGRMLQGMSDSPRAVSAMGLNVNVTKVVVFCLSAFVAGVAGVLLGCARGFAVATDPFYMSFNSMVLLAMLAIAPFAEPWYALVALAGVIPAYLTGDDTATWLNVLFGAAAIVVSMQGGSPAMPQALQRALGRLGGRRPGRPRAVVAAAPAPPRSAGLDVEDLTVRFGGLVAVDGISFSAPPGRITGLIGPNGAGKTTTFDAASGFNRPATGRIRLHDADVSRRPAAARGRLGLGRTFQRVELCDTLTVLQNVMLGVESSAVGSSVGAHLVAPPGRREAAEAAAWSALAACGIEDLADRVAGGVSTGQARLVELARLLAGPFDVLLLDEPSSGLDEEETLRFSALLRRLVAERGVGILLVEHDVEMVMRVCDFIYVLDFGRMIFEGPPAEVVGSEIVRAAYLGDDDVMAAVGGEQAART